MYFTLKYSGLKILNYIVFLTLMSGTYAYSSPIKCNFEFYKDALQMIVRKSPESVNQALGEIKSASNWNHLRFQGWESAFFDIYAAELRTAAQAKQSLSLIHPTTEEEHIDDLISGLNVLVMAKDTRHQVVKLYLEVLPLLSQLNRMAILRSLQYAEKYIPDVSQHYPAFFDILSKIALDPALPYENRYFANSAIDFFIHKCTPDVIPASTITTYRSRFDELNERLGTVVP